MNYVIDDRGPEIPEYLLKMSPEELDREIKKLETELLTNKRKVKLRYSEETDTLYF
jgi:ribosomal protein L29